jgi:hypothetical protein
VLDYCESAWARMDGVGRSTREIDTVLIL